jgi:hypothetical protein
MLKQFRKGYVRMQMRHILITTLLCGMLIQLPLQADAAELPAVSLSSRFTATLEFNSENLNSPQQIPQISFEGQIDILDKLIRLELVNEITQEPTLALLDVAAGTAAILYPDSLNGDRMPLGDDFRSSYLDLFTKFASSKELGEVKGWKLTSSKLKDGGKEYNYSGQSDRRVSFMTGPDNAPSLLTITSPKMTVRIRLESVEKQASLSAKDFKVPADFAMRESKTKLSEMLPSL